MKNVKVIFLILIGLASLAQGCSDASTVPTPQVTGVEIVEYGIYKVNVREKTAPGKPGVTTSNEVVGMVLLEQTDRIPAVLDKAFGFRFVVQGTPKGQAVKMTFRNTFPSPIKDAGTGQPRSSEEAVFTEEIGEESFHGFGFDHEEELVEGEWKMEVWYGDRKLAEQTFHVFKPDK
jgi:hypothetical protein